MFAVVTVGLVPIAVVGVSVAVRVPIDGLLDGLVVDLLDVDVVGGVHGDLEGLLDSLVGGLGDGLVFGLDDGHSLGPLDVHVIREVDGDLLLLVLGAVLGARHWLLHILDDRLVLDLNTVRVEFRKI